MAQKGQATRVVLTETSTIVDWVVKPGSWVSKKNRFVLRPSESMWVSRTPGAAAALISDKRA